MNYKTVRELVLKIDDMEWISYETSDIIKG